jgi:hypothetical protein
VADFWGNRQGLAARSASTSCLAFASSEPGYRQVAEKVRSEPLADHPRQRLGRYIRWPVLVITKEVDGRKVGRMSRVILLLLLATAIGGRALALSPRPETSILWQGTPILLVDKNELLMCHCDSATGKNGVELHYTIERLDTVGKVLERLPTPPSAELDAAWAPFFKRTYLDGHPRKQLGAEFFWTDLRRAFPVEGRRLTLTLAKSVLTCAEPGMPIERRDLGCTPSEVTVFETNDMAFFDPHRDPQHPVVVVGACHPDAHTKHEVVAVCGATAARLELQDPHKL